MHAYVLVEIGDSEAIDLFLREQDAQEALEDALRDEPGWAGTLTAEPNPARPSTNLGQLELKRPAATASRT